MDVEFLQAMDKGTVNHSAWAEYWDGAIAKVILSQTMTTDDGSSKSQAEVHATVALAVIKGDADLLMSSFNAGPVRWLTEWNFPGATPPKVWRKFEEEADLKEVAENWKSVGEATGFRPTIEEVTKVFGGDWEENPGAAAQPTEFSENANRRVASRHHHGVAVGRQCGCTTVAEGEGDLIDEAVDGLGDDWEPVLDPIVGEALRRIESAATFAEVGAILTELADEDGLDDSQLREVLAGANLTGRAIGDTDTDNASTRLGEETAGAEFSENCNCSPGHLKSGGQCNCDLTRSRAKGECNCIEDHLKHAGKCNCGDW
jgi:phage gp29-like protein